MSASQHHSTFKTLYFLHPNSKPRNSIRDAHTPQPGEIVFNTMGYRRSETVQASGDFQRKQYDIMFHTYTP